MGQVEQGRHVPRPSKPLGNPCSDGGPMMTWVAVVCGLFVAPMGGRALPCIG